jgi:hypothetical protein
MAGFEVIIYGRFPETSLFKVGDCGAGSVVRGGRDGLLLLLGVVYRRKGFAPRRGRQFRMGPDL